MDKTSKDEIVEKANPTDKFKDKTNSKPDWAGKRRGKFNRSGKSNRLSKKVNDAS